MLENFDVTIVIPTFNNIEFLEETINSVILSGLNYRIEILVGIDGCEKTKEFVKTISFPHYVKFQYFIENGGPYTIKNTLVKIANSDKIIFFDSDDLMSENLIPKIVKILDNYEITKFRYINFTDQNNILTKSKKAMPYAEGVFGVKKNLFLRMNGFEPWVCAADSDYWGRIYKANIKTHFINEVLMLRRLHESQLTRRNDTGMKSTLRAHYWRLSTSKRGDGNPSFLSTRDFYEIDDITSKNLKVEYINILKRKESIVENIKTLMVANNLTPPLSKPKKQPPVELNYDLVNKLMIKKLKLTQEQESKPNLIQNRQNLFDLKRKKI